MIGTPAAIWLEIHWECHPTVCCTGESASPFPELWVLRGQAQLLLACLLCDCVMSIIPPCTPQHGSTIGTTIHRASSPSISGRTRQRSGHGGRRTEKAVEAVVGVDVGVVAALLVLKALRHEGRRTAGFSASAQVGSDTSRHDEDGGAPQHLRHCRLRKHLLLQRHLHELRVHCSPPPHSQIEVPRLSPSLDLHLEWSLGGGGGVRRTK